MSRGIPSDVHEQISDLLRRIAVLEQRVQNQKRTGRVLKVDAAKGIVVELDEDPVTGKRDSTEWIPWQETAMGGTKSHFPPTVGEQVDITSETGDGHDWRATLSTPSDDNKRPHDGLDKNGFWRGKFSMTWGDDWFEIAIGSSVFRVEAGKISARADEITEDAKTLISNGALTAKGDWVQTGTHTDSRGIHK